MDVGIGDAEFSVDVGLKLLPLLLLLTYFNVVVFGIAVDAMAKKKIKRNLLDLIIEVDVYQTNVSNERAR